MTLLKVFAFFCFLYFSLCGVKVLSFMNTSANSPSFATLSYHDKVPQNALFQVFHQVKQYHQKQREQLLHVNEKSLLNQTKALEENMENIPLDVTFEKSYDDIRHVNNSSFETIAPDSELQGAFFTPMSHSTTPLDSDAHYSLIENLFNIWSNKHNIRYKEHKKSSTNALA